MLLFLFHVAHSICNVNLYFFLFRLSAQELLECSFLAVEPDVQLLATDPSHKLLTLQVVFKGSDKVSVKFEFNVVRKYIYILYTGCLKIRP